MLLSSKLGVVCPQYPGDTVSFFLLLFVVREVSTSQTCCVPLGFACRQIQRPRRVFRGMRLHAALMCNTSHTNEHRHARHKLCGESQSYRNFSRVTSSRNEYPSLEVNLGYLRTDTLMSVLYSFVVSFGPHPAHHHRGHRAARRQLSKAHVPWWLWRTCQKLLDRMVLLACGSSVYTHLTPQALETCAVWALGTG